MKTKLVLTFFLLIHAVAFTQEYYVFMSDLKILDKQGLEQKIEQFNQKLKGQINQSKTHVPVAGYRIVSTSKKGDSIIHKVRFDFKFEATRNEKIYSFENSSLPEFNLKNLKSKKVSSKDLKGKTTFINLWFTNCFPCVKEIPLLNVLQKKYKDKVNFVAITYDPKQKVKAFLKKKAFDFEHLVDADTYLKEKLGNRAYPKIIIVDKDGIVQYMGDGVPSEYDYDKRKMKERTEKDLAYLEKILDGLL